ncbi:ATP-dependent zinc protease [Candidatus Falkowbacteria bacterium]|nr:ATP-dependent zinc protease [Candidatus Falkowbacteria bacterium]
MKDKVILGMIEHVTVHGSKGQEAEVLARIDTGATSSSIDYTLAGELLLGPVISSKVVKSASGVKKRPTLKVKITLKGTKIEEEFTLADRSHMTYRILLGQNVLRKGNFLIDPLKRVETR